MNRALIQAFLRQRLTSPMRVALLAFMLLPGVGIAAVTLQIGVLSSTGLVLALVLAAGAIGQEVSSGVLTLTFARPVSRASYVFSRWFAAGAFAAALAALQLAAACTAIAARGGLPPAADIAGVALGNTVTALAGSALVLMLSSLVNGLGDMALYFIAVVATQLAGALAQYRHWTVAGRVVEEVHRTLQPDLQLAWLFGRGDPAWPALVSALSTLTLGLAVAVWVLNRKELSYAAD